MSEQMSNIDKLNSLKTLLSHVTHQIYKKGIQLSIDPRMSGKLSDQIILQKRFSKVRPSKHYKPSTNMICRHRRLSKISEEGIKSEEAIIATPHKVYFSKNPEVSENKAKKDPLSKMNISPEKSPISSGNPKALNPLKMHRPVRRVLPVQRTLSPTQTQAVSVSKIKGAIGCRYTVDDYFLNLWRTELNDHYYLLFIQKQWSSDDWDGLFDPPEWLRPEMFTVALTGPESNSLKREKFERAKANLKMANLTHSCRTNGLVSSSLKNDELYEAIIDIYNRHFNAVGVNLLKMITKIIHAIDEIKLYTEEAGVLLVSAAQKFNVEIGADLKNKTLNL